MKKYIIDTDCLALARVVCEPRSYLKKTMPLVICLFVRSNPPI